VGGGDGGPGAASVALGGTSAFARRHEPPRRHGHPRRAVVGGRRSAGCSSVNADGHGADSGGQQQHRGQQRNRRVAG